MKIVLIFLIFYFCDTIFSGCCGICCCCNKNHKTDKKFDSSGKIELTKNFKFINCSFTQKNNICWLASPLLALLNCPVFQEFIRNAAEVNAKIKIMKKILSDIEKKQGCYREDFLPYYQEFLEDIKKNAKDFWKEITEVDGRERVLEEEGFAGTFIGSVKYLSRDLKKRYMLQCYYSLDFTKDNQSHKIPHEVTERFIDFANEFSKKYSFWSMVINKVLDNAAEKYFTKNKLTTKDVRFDSFGFHSNYNSLINIYIIIFGDESVINDMKKYNSILQKRGINFDCFLDGDKYNEILNIVEDNKNEFLNNYDLQLNSIIFGGEGHYFTVSRDESGKFYDLSTLYDNELDKIELREFDFWNNFNNFLFELPRNNLKNKVEKSVNKPSLVVVTIKRK